MSIIEGLAKWYFRRLEAYRRRDEQVRELMNRAVSEYILSKNPGDEGLPGLVEEILNYRTRLYEAGTVLTLTIWGGNRGFKDALTNPSATELAVTLRLAFGEGDIIDTASDEYDPKILELLGKGRGEVEEAVRRYRLYQEIISYLDGLIYERFSKLHPLGHPIYREYRGRVEEGQREDIELRYKYLRGDYEEIRRIYPTKEAVMELLVRKLGLMGEAAARISYQESGGRDQSLEDILASFYLNAGVLIQFWENDVKKLPLDIKELNTNPILTYTITHYRDIDHLDKEIVVRLLKENPKILDELAEPYTEALEESLKEIKRYSFDPRTHKGLYLGVKRMAEKEKAALLKGFGLG